MVGQGDEALLQPPFDPELIADLHAGLFDPPFEARLGAAVESDPQARQVLAALDSVSTRLAELRADNTPAPPAPPEVLDRIHAALAAEGAPAPVDTVPLVALAEHPRRRRAWIPAAAAAAILLLAGGIALGTGVFDEDPEAPAPTMAQPFLPRTDEPDLGADLTPGAALIMMGRSSLGPLSGPDALAGCLRANGVDPATPLLGSGPVRIRGIRGILMLFAGPRPPQITALVVGAECTESRPETLARSDIG
ncbi:hypothetical protein O4215_09965 [Rhodococcus maanshanensis]|uniref:hypothetical protein n=1 Tax=Rhodococcus maanshanensis TaxID=183556 RepID=UPI0022B335A9|nr:hypothetical protein [Rhodococcus maanshanensis]MCZ4555904.1 hypothetical protein [Rhodococcus maanshanensis]